MPWFTLVMVAAAPGPSLLRNGDFEVGLEGWSVTHNWYEHSQGAGTSPVTAVDEGRGGGKALRIDGGGKRGIAMQVFPAYPGRYRVTGWIRCQNLAGVEAKVLCEWMGHDNKWLRGDAVGAVTGDADWTYFDTVVEAADGTRSIHFDLLTTGPNDGTAWFDDLTMERLPGDLPVPAAPSIAVAAPEGDEGCLAVSWDPEQLTRGVVRLLLYADTGATDAPPLNAVEALTGRATLTRLQNGVRYLVSAVAVNADGAVSPRSEAVAGTPADRRPPRPGWLDSERITHDGPVRVGWSPHVLDLDVAVIEVLLPPIGEGAPQVLRRVEVTDAYDKTRPLYCTAPWVSFAAAVSPEIRQLGVRCTDRAGNQGSVGWYDILPAPGPGAAPAVLWTTPPTTQLPRSADPPEERSAGFSLLALRGQAQGFQVMLKPERALGHVRVQFDAPAHENGRDRIDPRWLAWHFVDYCSIEGNSRATPKDELLWPAPSEYPDELADDLVRDLPADRLQPIFVRVTAPRDAAPGRYTGRARVVCDEGQLPFEFSLEIAPVELPEERSLKFVYWFSWQAPCRELGVEERSEDGWRVLRRLGELMTAYHQNVVTVPLGLIRAWQREDDTLAWDFRDFDRFIDTMDGAGVRAMYAISHIGSRTTGEWLCPTMGAHGFSARRLPSGEAVTISSLDVLPALQDHLEARGLLDRAALHIADEPIPQNVESYRELSAQAHERAPKLRRIDAIHVPDLRGALEIWVPQLNYFEQWYDQYKAAQAEGYELWFYVAWVPQGKYPNRMIDSAAIKSRVLHWLNYTGGTTGYLHWALNHWQIPLSSLESPGDQYICWPSQRFVADSSLRYEAERAGLDDAELMAMLQRAWQAAGVAESEARDRVVAIVRDAVRGAQDYSRSWDELEAVRRRLLQALLAAR